MENKLGELAEAIKAETEALNENLTAFLNKGNKAAGQRARKNTLVLGKLYKEFRALSVKAN